MTLNQILHDEQIAMMRHAAATSLAEVGRHRREIDRIGRMLSHSSYPHRPYLVTGEAMASGKSRKILRLAIRSRWAAEAGAA